MKARLTIGLAAALLSCGRNDLDSNRNDHKLDGGTRRPLVKLNGYVLDVQGLPPLVPVELEPAEERVLGEIPNVAIASDLEAVAGGRSAAKAVRSATRQADPNRKKWIVQFHGPIHEADKAQLTALGARLGDYLPDFAFVVSMDDQTRGLVEGLAVVRGVARYKPAYKISHRLKDEAGAVRKDLGEAVRIRARVDAADGLPAFLSEVHNGSGKVVGVGRDVAQAEVAPGLIARLAAFEEVLWIEEAIQPQLLNDTSRWTIQSYVPGWSPMSEGGLDGAGQIVGVGDTGLDYDMCWFRDPSGAPIGPSHRKVVGYASYADYYDGDFGHGTHVSGTVAGEQFPVTGGRTANGMAPAARLFVTDLTPGDANYVYPPDDLGQMFLAPYEAGARIHTNSWGAPFNMYEMGAWSTDRFMWQHKDFLVLFANGNSGPNVGTVGFPATAKNVISVGATENGELAENVAYFSSNGPASDGRFKPTLTAPGVAVWSADSDGIQGTNNCGTVAYSGTSMATPTAAGAAALVRQYYVDGYWPSGMANPADALAPSAALVKATLINAAQPGTGEYTDGPIPSTGQGWGRVNLSNTLRFAGDTKFLDVADVSPGLETGTSWTKQFYANGGLPLKITLVWTDYPGAQGTYEELVNNLDLTVVAPDGATYLGNVFSGGASHIGGESDWMNVEEQVYIPVSASGWYTISVMGYNVPFGPQPFAVVVSGAGGITSQGFIALDRQRYGAATTIRVKVGDLDLNVDPEAIDEAFVTIQSAADPEGELVRLVEIAPDASIFLGSIPTGHAPGTAEDGIVAVSEGATITASYADANDGTGAPATVTASAVGDLTPTTVSGVSVAALGQGHARIAWTTADPASAAVLFGKTPALGAMIATPWLATSHDLFVGALEEDTTYYYAVQATDEAGNVALDDAGGTLRMFTTLVEPPEVEVYSSRGVYTYESETVIFGTARDPSGVESLTVNGHSITPGVDGYYEFAVPLDLGDNSFAVVATDTRGETRTAAITVTREPLPDLVVASVTTAERAGVGVPFLMTMEICNVGPGAAEVWQGSWRIVWALLEVEQNQLVVLDVQKRWDWLNPGACLSLARSFTVGPSAGGRTFLPYAIADIGDAIWEENEDNNDMIGASAITFDSPDLTVTQLESPENVQAATPFDVTVTLANVGLGGAWGPTVNVYLSTDDVITTEDRRVAVKQITSFVPPGGSVTLTSTVTLPNDVPAGTYRLGAIVDPLNGIAEANEANNVLLGPSITVASADLRVAAVSGPSTALTGGDVAVHHVVEALAAGGGATEFKVALYLSQDPVITTGDLKLGEHTVTGLASGASASADTIVTIPRTWAGGTYYVGAIVDPGNQILESDESNNAAVGNTLTIFGPDLVATYVGAPASAVAGGTILVEDTVVASASGGAAPEFDVAIFLSTDPVITSSDTLLGWRRVPALQPGTASTASTTVAIPVQIAAGAYYVGVIADDFTHCWEDEWETQYCVGGDVAKEPDATNNVRVGGSIAITGADLTMTEVSAPASAATGQPLVVRNTVSASGGGTGGFDVAFYLSSDATITTSDVYLGKRGVPGLPPGGSSTADTSLTVPVTLVPGTYYVGAIADAGKSVAESNEANNALAGSAVSIAGADLVATAISGPQTAATAASFDVTTTVANQGVGSGPSYYLSVYLSADAIVTTSDLLLANRSVASLGPGGSITVTTTISIPSSVVPGTYYLGAIADPYNSVKESNETNNALAGSAIAVTGPDLVVTAAAAPATAMTGGTILVDQSVANTSSGGASSFIVGIYLSTDLVITTSDVYLGSRYVSSLAAGSSSAGSTAVTIPTTLRGGTYYVGAIVDRWNSVAESDEGNNALAAGLIAITGPDLVATALNGPASVARGSGITVTDTVAVSGTGGAAPEFYVGFFLSTDPVITAADRFIGSRYVSGLGPGATSSASTFMMVPADLAPGTYYLGMIVDNFVMYIGDQWDGYDVYDNAKESDETNNTLSGSAMLVTVPGT